MAATPGRIDWVDYAKGICIIMVVTMHSTLGVEKFSGTEGWMHAVVEFAKPFRMPDFFLISGLFLSRVIDRPWPDYLDRKLVHFGYFYLLWMTIQCVIKCPFYAETWTDIPAHWAFSLIQPFGTLWFIYMLPIFFVVCKLARTVPVWMMWAGAALLHMAQVETGWTVIDEFASRFVFFYSGAIFARYVFETAAFARANIVPSIGFLALWALVNGGLVAKGASTIAPVSLFLGFAGAFAVILVATLLAEARIADAIRYCGEKSLVIYLAFFFPMLATRTILLKLGIVPDTGTLSVIVTAAGVIGALVGYWIVRGTRFAFLFRRPAWAITDPRHASPQPAE